MKQGGIDLKDRVFLINNICSWLWEGGLPLEPYPASLRIMNVIRFLNTNVLEEVEKKKIESFVLAEVNYLSMNLEYHLLANHLLENAFALWMGALENYNQIYGDMSGSKSIASILVYPEQSGDPQRAVSIASYEFSSGKNTVGIIGAGNFTSAMILPYLKKVLANLKFISSLGGLSGTTLAKKFGLANP